MTWLSNNSDGPPKVGDIVGNDPQGIGDCPKCQQFIVYGCWHRCLTGLVMVLHRPAHIDGEACGNGS